MPGGRCGAGWQGPRVGMRVARWHAGRGLACGPAATRRGVGCGRRHRWRAEAAGAAGAWTWGHPRPTNGIFVAITVINNTLASGGRPAM